MDLRSQLSSSSSSSPTTSIWSVASDIPSSSPTSSFSSNSANNSDYEQRDVRTYLGYLEPVGDGEAGFGGGGFDWELERVEKSWNCSSSFGGSDESTSTSPSFSLLHLNLDPRTIHIPAAESISSPQPSNSVDPGLLNSSSSSSKTRRVDLGAVGSDGEELDGDELEQRRKKEKRKVTNRISARNFRERRRKEQDQLEKVLELRDHELEVLRREAERLRAENSNLKADDRQ